MLRRNQRRGVGRTSQLAGLHLQMEPLEPRVVLTSLLFLGGQAGPTQGADAQVMDFLETTYGANNVSYKQASAANNTSDLNGIDLLILSSTTGSGSYRNKYHNSAVPILNWEEAVMDAGSGEFGLSSQSIVKSTSMTQMTIAQSHAITAGLTGTIDFVSAGAETLSTNSLFAGLTSVTVAANGTAANGNNSVVGNPTIFFAEAGQPVNPGSGASPAKGRRVMFPMTDSTFSSLTADGRQLFENAVNWAAGVPTGPPTVSNSAATNITAVAAQIGGEVGQANGEVTVYWGDNDGGTSPGSWDHAVNLGNQSGAFSTMLAELEPSTTHYFRAFVMNAAGNDWADATSSFTTATLSLPQVVISPASNVTDDTAVVGGGIAATGGDTPAVTIYWGDNDGGVSADNWDASIDLGLQPANFAATLTDLNPQTAYFYRIQAENAAGVVWSSTTGSFVTASVSLRDTVMFNDHVAGPATHVNATAYSANLIASGPLKDFETGDTTEITLTVSQSGVNYAGSSAFPSDGTDADDIFGGVIDFSVSSGTSLEIAGNDHYTHTYTNLDVNSEYEFAGTAIRGNPAYTNRWTLVTLQGVESATPSHSSGDGIVTAGLNSNQAALWVGDNSQANQGYVVQWTGIDPGVDGEFQVVQSQYTGSVPTSIHSGGTATGSKGYGLSATRLIESFSALAVVSSDPQPGAKLTEAPRSVTLNFSLPVDTNSIAATDVTLDGVAATGVTVLDADSVRFDLPIVGIGNHNISIAAGAVVTPEGLSLVGYSIPFAIATTATVTPAAEMVLATSARVGGDVVSTGFDDPALQVFFGTSDGGTNAANWQRSVSVGQVSGGRHFAQVEDLLPNTEYFYRVRATNISGVVWSGGGAFTTQAAMLPTVENGPVDRIGPFSAEVSGQVLALGNDIPAVTIFYGDEDGGTTPANWDSSLDLGKQTGEFSQILTGLEAETIYFFRVRGQNAAGTSWAPTSGMFTTDEVPLLLINELQASNSTTLTTRTRLSVDDSYGVGTDSPDWIEIFNPSPTTIDLGGFHLTDSRNDLTKWKFPTGTTIGEFGYLVVFASGENIRNSNLDQQGLLHTNFVLQSSGEYLALTGAEGEIVHELSFPKQQTDISYGLDSEGNAVYFTAPTPESANSSSTADGIVGDTSFSIDRGFFDAPFTTTITSSTPGATIVYTTDGSEPTISNGTRVPSALDETPSASVAINTTTSLRAFAFKSGLLSTNVDAHTYIFLDDVLQQPNNPPGFPGGWGGAPAADYEMDSQIVNNPSYSQDLIDGLREIPTLSVNSSIANVFGGGGLYSNTGSNIEVPASAEWILPDGSSGFQINAGFKLQGGASRNPGSSPKHSLSLRFRETYGAGELEYPLFEGSPVDRFDTLQLRAMYNNSWIHWSPDQRRQGTLIRDQFFRDSLLDMGQVDAQRGTYAHLYIDGIYWGVYNVHERAEASHYAAYNGGDPAELDALNGGSPNDGNLSSYNAMKATVASRNWDAIQEVLDVDNYIDWTIMQRFAGNRDLKGNGNWRAAGGGPNNAPWKFYSWDAERTLENPNQNGAGGTPDPPGLLSSLDDIEEFRIRFADRLQMHMFNDGALTPQANLDRLNARVTELENAIVAESARWGDYRRDVHVRGAAQLYTRDTHWLPEINRLRNSYFPQRTNTVLNQYRSLNLFPSLAAPLYRIDGVPQHGGEVSVGDDLTMSSSGTVYYTLDGTDPRADGGGIAGQRYRPGIDPPLVLETSMTIRARALTGNTWSALTETTFVVVPAAGSIVVSEINYNPHGPTEAELAVAPTLSSNDFDFLEVTNVHPTADINLAGMRFVTGVEFEFPSVTLSPGESAVVVEDAAAFQVRYGNDVNVLGQWSGGLSNGGERLVLLDGTSEVMLDFEFSDNSPWSNRADGAGATLELVDINSTPVEENGKWYRWQGSVDFGGSPGGVGVAAPQVLISEVNSNTDMFADLSDSIELYNPTTSSIDISGWFLSDGAGDLQKFQIPNGTILSPGGYVVFDESHFNSEPEAANSFALSGTQGDEVYLTIGDGQGGVAQFVDSVNFGAAVPGESFGRLTNGLFVPQSEATLGCGIEAYPRTETVVISEINYNPGEPSPSALAIYPSLVEDDLEFVEIYNSAATAVDLSDWRLRGGVDYEFDPSLMLNGQEALVIVSFNPESPANVQRTQAFRAHYQIDDDVRLLGGFGGQLSDSGESVRLRRPGSPVINDPTATPRFLADEIVYDDRNGWPVNSDGSGMALARTSATSNSYLAVAWSGNTPSPGTALFTAVPGDFDGDGAINATDIEIVLSATQTSPAAAVFDRNGDGSVTMSDATTIVEQTMGILFGDANLDGTVDSVDLNEVGIHWQQQGCLNWSSGDFNGDNLVSSADLNAVGVNWQQSAATPAQLARQPRAPLSVPVERSLAGTESTATSQSEPSGAVSADRQVPDEVTRQRRNQTNLRRRAHGQEQSRDRQEFALQADDFFAEL